MKILIDGTVDPTGTRFGVFFLKKSGKTKQVYPRKKKPKKSRWDRIFNRQFPGYFRAHRKEILALLTIEELDVKAEFGMADAAATAISTGTLYNAWGFFTALLQNYISVKKIKAHVKPVFQKKSFSAKVRCIVKLSIGKAIRVVFDFLKEAYRNERTSYLRTYDHSYAKH